MPAVAVNEFRGGDAVRVRQPLVSFGGSIPDGGDRARRPRKVTFLTRSLDHGGAERQLVVLAKELHRRGHAVLVLVFYPGTPLESELTDAGVRVRSLGKTGRWDVLGFLWRLYRVLCEERPDVLHGYLDVPNASAILMRALMPRLRVVWGVRASNMDLSRYDWLARAADPAVRSLSRYAHLIIANSQAGSTYVVSRGYPPDTIVVIPNGIDTDRFRPDRVSGHRVRREWNVAPGEKLVGLVGRIDPMKDHPTFLAAAARVASMRGDVRFVCVGDGDPRYRRQLQRLADGLGLTHRLVWAGTRADMPAVFNALDVACSSSRFGEGFPNVIGEAMACGVPCVVTDVGDSAWILDQPALVSPPGNPDAFAQRLTLLLDGGEAYAARAGTEARHRIVGHFSVARLVTATEDALAGLFTDGAR